MHCIYASFGKLLLWQYCLAQYLQNKNSFIGWARDVTGVCTNFTGTDGHVGGDKFSRQVHWSLWLWGGHRFILTDCGWYEGVINWAGSSGGEGVMVWGDTFTGSAEDMDWGVWYTPLFGWMWGKHGLSQLIYWFSYTQGGHSLSRQILWYWWWYAPLKMWGTLTISLCSPNCRYVSWILAYPLQLMLLPCDFQK